MSRLPCAEAIVATLLQEDVKCTESKTLSKTKSNPAGPPGYGPDNAIDSYHLQFGLFQDWVKFIIEIFTVTQSDLNYTFN